MAALRVRGCRADVEGPSAESHSTPRDGFGHQQEVPRERLGRACQGVQLHEPPITSPWITGRGDVLPVDVMPLTLPTERSCRVGGVYGGVSRRRSGESSRLERSGVGLGSATTTIVVGDDSGRTRENRTGTSAAVQDRGLGGESFDDICQLLDQAVEELTALQLEPQGQAGPTNLPTPALPRKTSGRGRLNRPLWGLENFASKSGHTLGGDIRDLMRPERSLRLVSLKEAGELIDEAARTACRSVRTACKLEDGQCILTKRHKPSGKINSKGVAVYGGDTPAFQRPHDGADDLTILRWDLYCYLAVEVDCRPRDTTTINYLKRKAESWLAKHHSDLEPAEFFDIYSQVIARLLAPTPTEHHIEKIMRLEKAAGIARLNQVCNGQLAYGHKWYELILRPVLPKWVEHRRLGRVKTILPPPQ